MVEVNLQNLTGEQLDAFESIDPIAAGIERERRFAYETLQEGFTALAQAGLDLDTALAAHRNTAVCKSVKGSRIDEVVRRLLATARALAFEYKTPVLGGADGPTQ